MLRHTTTGETTTALLAAGTAPGDPLAGRLVHRRRHALDFVTSPALATPRVSRAGAVASAGSALYLELSQLRFFSLEGGQVLDSGTRPFRAGGGRVVLTGVSGSVALVIEFAGLDKQPGVVVAD